MDKRGVPLGNHTFSHPSLDEVSVEQFKADIDRNEAPLVLFTSQNWRYFRYPFLREGNSLEKKTTIRNYLKSKGYKIAEVTVDFEDWSWNAPYARCKKKEDLVSIEWLKSTYLRNAVDALARARKLSDALFKRPVPHVLLLHVGAFDVEMLEDLIRAYKEKGVEFIPLSAALNNEIYSLEPDVTFDAGAELTYQILKSRHLSLKDIGLDHYTGYPESELKARCL